MDLKSISFCRPTQIGTDVFTHMSVAPTTPNGTQELKYDATPPGWVVVTFRGVEYYVPLGNVAALVKREKLEPVEMKPVITDESQELGDVSFCTCGAKHFNFEKICKQCTQPIFGRGSSNGDPQEEDHQEEPETADDVGF